MTTTSQNRELEHPEEVMRLLAVQTEAYGFQDIPVLCSELRPYDGGTAMDVGTGDGSFLFKVAANHPTVAFVGLELSPSLLKAAQLGLSKSKLTNVRLAAGEFGTTHTEKHDVILARFAFQHTANTEELVSAAHAALNPGGLFYCIEPIYDYYGSYPPDAIWQAFRERTLVSYERWGSHPNLPKLIPRWLVAAGFSSVRVSIQLYSAATIGAGRFQTVVLATARMLNLAHPEIWDDNFTADLRNWIQLTCTDPYITIAHIRAVKPGNHCSKING